MAFRLGAMSGDPAVESFVYLTAAGTYARLDSEIAREYAWKSRELAQQSGNLDAIAESLHTTGYAAWLAATLSPRSMRSAAGRSLRSHR